MVGVRVIVNSFRDFFSVLLRAQHYTMFTTFGSVSKALFFRGTHRVRDTFRLIFNYLLIFMGVRIED